MAKDGFKTYEDFISSREVPYCSFCSEPFRDAGRTGHYCIACRSASYCNDVCQRNHWPQHKTFCKAEAKRRFDVSHEFAKKGYPQAMFYTASYYGSGFGVRKDMDEALRWATRAAEKGHPEAAYNVAVYLRQKSGGDDEEANRWILRAAELGLREAQFLVAKRFLKGGKHADLVQAATWLRRAADQCHPRAARMLGDAYATGEGVPVDYVEAMKLYRTASAGGDARASWSVATFILYRMGIPDGKCDNAEAVHYLHKAASLGSQAAQVMLGREYSSKASILVPLDMPQALMWYRRAASGPPCDHQTEAIAGVEKLEAELGK